MTQDPPGVGMDPRDGGGRLRRLGLLCSLVGACAPALVTHDPLPGWGLDPLTTVAPFDGIGPSGEILLAALALAGLALVLLGAAGSRERLPTVALVLGAIGLVPVVYHGWLGPDACVENVRIGLVWTGSLAGALSAFIACRHREERGLALAACAGVVGPLVLRAAIQVYSEHPQLLQDYRARREEILASHGWSPESALARSYERRLATPDASAWFAMSNVYASAMAGCAGAFAGGAWIALRSRLWATGDRRDLYRLAGLVGGLVLAVGGLLIAAPAGGSPSKGGVGAMALGFGLVGVGLLHPRLPRVLSRLASGRVIGVGVVALVLLAVVARGWVGERIGELSLLFRWFYLEASARIFAGHLVWGVGPDGFQSAYLLAKNPLNPEEVSSPHSVLFEYLTTLGGFGLAWGAVIVALGASAGRTLVEPSDDARPGPNREIVLRRLAPVLLVCGALSFCTQALPLARAVPDAFGLLLFDGAVRVLAWLLLWLGLATALLSVAHRAAARVGLAAGALAVLAHSQIELTATDAGAAGWALLVLGAAAARPREGVAPTMRTRLIPGALVGVLAGMGAAAMVVGWIPVRRWQATLRVASGSVSTVTALRNRLGALGPTSAPGEPLAIVAELSELLGEPVEPTPEGVAEGMRRLRLARVSEAADRLEALARDPRAASRHVVHMAIRLRGAESSLASGPDGQAAGVLSRAEALAEWTTARWPNDSRAWRDLAQVREALGRGGSAPRAAPVEALERAAALDPHSPDAARLLAEAYRDLGRTEEAKAWAARALGAHEAMRLDPLAGLSDSQLASLRELLGNP